MLILLYMPFIFLTMMVESQLKGNPYDILTLDRPEYFARHLMRVHLCVASFSGIYIILAIMSQ